MGYPNLSRALLLVFALFLGLAAVRACSSITVGKKASVDGSVMTSYTDDCIDCDFRLGRVPRRRFDKGDKRPVYPVYFTYPRYVGYERGDVFHPSKLEKGLHGWNLSEPIGFIDQVSHTFSYLDGGYGIMNEHQLAIGESTCGAKLISTPRHAGGHALFDVSDLGRIALERCKTARCAVQTMGQLAVEYGFYGAEWGPGTEMEGGESFSVTDPTEAWIFHISADDTGKSAVWAAQRVPDDHVAVVANGFIIRQLDLSQPDYFMASDNIFDVAQRAGLWDDSEEFDFQKVYGYQVSVYKEEYIARRWWRVLDYVAPSRGLLGNMTTKQLPFSLKPDKLVSARDIMFLLRDHFEGTPYDMTVGVQAGPYGNPNRYDAYMDDKGEVPKDLMAKGHFERPISMFRTSYSFVSQSRSWLPDAMGGVVWFGNHAPHATVYTPFYSAASSVPEPYQIGSLFKLNHKSAWWAFCAVANWAERMYMHIIGDIQAEYTKIEDAEFKNLEKVEKRALSIYEHSKHPEKEKEVKEMWRVLDEFTSDNANQVVEAWWDLFYRLIAKYHDGYRLSDPHAARINLQKLFFPRWWLEAIDWWKQPEGDIAAKEPKPDITPSSSSAFVFSPTLAQQQMKIQQAYNQQHGLGERSMQGQQNFGGVSVPPSEVFAHEAAASSPSASASLSILPTTMVIAVVFGLGVLMGSRLSLMFKRSAYESLP